VHPKNPTISRGTGRKHSQARSLGQAQLHWPWAHGIPVKIVFTLTDLTTSTVIDSSTQLSGHGHGHPHQATTECTGVVFSGAASDFFGAHLPPGVAPTDTVEASIDAFVIIKR
jgi:hypothetical protein